MKTLRRVNTAAAGVTLLAGVFAVTVRVAPMVAPSSADAALTQLALAFGQDLGQPAAASHPASSAPDGSSRTTN